MAKKTIRRKDGIYIPKTASELEALDQKLRKARYMPMDNAVGSFSVEDTRSDKALGSEWGSEMLAGNFGGDLMAEPAICFDDRQSTAIKVALKDKKKNDEQLGYIPWGPGNKLPVVIPQMAAALPYTAAPAKYLADLTAGLGLKAMYRMTRATDNGRVESEYIPFEDAGLLLKKRVRDLESTQSKNSEAVAGSFLIPAEKYESEELKEARAALADWEHTWFGTGDADPGLKRFLEENNVDLHLIRCMQDDVMLDIYFPTIGLQRGRPGEWKPKIISVDTLSAATCRLEKQNQHRHINHVYYSEKWRMSKNLEGTDNEVIYYDAVMPQQALKDLRYLVKSNQKTRVKDRPTWIVLPTYYPSLLKAYYPQPAWWSIFPSRIYKYASTIIADKDTARQNKTTFGKIFYISIDFLTAWYAQHDIAENDYEKQQEVVDKIKQELNDFLTDKRNHGKTLQQYMWVGPDGKEHKGVEIVDVSTASKDAEQANATELEGATNAIFLAWGVDPRLVGVPIMGSSNGGTAQRELHLIKQQQQNPRQRLYLQFWKVVSQFNGWSEHLTWVIKQQTLTTLDNSKTGTVETIAGEGA